MDFEMTRPQIAKFNMRQKSQKYIPFALILTFSIPNLGLNAVDKPSLNFQPTKESRQYQPELGGIPTLKKTQIVFKELEPSLACDRLKALGEFAPYEKIGTPFNFSYDLALNKAHLPLNEAILPSWHSFNPSEELIDWLESDSTSSNLKSLIHKVTILTPKKITAEQFFSVDVSRFTNISSLLKKSHAVAKVYLETPKELMGLDHHYTLKLVSIETSKLPPLPSNYDLNPEPISQIQIIAEDVGIDLQKPKNSSYQEIPLLEKKEHFLAKEIRLEKFPLKMQIAIDELEGVEIDSTKEEILAQESVFMPRAETFEMPAFDHEINSALQLEKQVAHTPLELALKEERLLLSVEMLLDKPQMPSSVEFELPEVVVAISTQANDLQNHLEIGLSSPSFEEPFLGKVDSQEDAITLNMPVFDLTIHDVAIETNNNVTLATSSLKVPKAEGIIALDSQPIASSSKISLVEEGDFLNFIHSLDLLTYSCALETNLSSSVDLIASQTILNLSLQFDTHDLYSALEEIKFSLHPSKIVVNKSYDLAFVPSLNMGNFDFYHKLSDLDSAYQLVTYLPETKPHFAEKTGLETFKISQNVIKELPKFLAETASYVELLAKNENHFDPTQVVTIDNRPSENLDSSYRSILKRKAYDYLSFMPTLHELNTYVLSADFRHEAEVIASPDGESYYFSVQLMPYYPEDLRKIHQNVYFVLDQSRTISEERFEAFKKGILRSIPYLSQEASFNVIVLNKHYDVLNLTNLSNDKEAMELAKSFLDKISYSFTVSPQEYSQVIPFIEEKFQVNPDDLNTIILLSDGAAYKNFHIYRDKISEVCMKNKHKFQLYTVAASQDNYLNALDMVAFHNFGQLLYSKTNAALPRQLAILVKNMRHPIANNLHLSTIRNESDQIIFFPPSGQLPALYADKPLTIYGKTNCLQNFDLMIQGKADNEWINISQSVNLRQAKRGDRELLRNVQLMEKKLRYFQETDTVDET